MTSLITIKTEVEKLKEVLAPKFDDETWVVMWAPPDGDPETDVEVARVSDGYSTKCRYGELSTYDESQRFDVLSSKIQTKQSRGEPYIIDGMHFGGRRRSSTTEDSTSQTNSAAESAMSLLTEMIRHLSRRVDSACRVSSFPYVFRSDFG